MEELEYVIIFDRVSNAEAAQYAAELRERLRDISPNVSAEFERDAHDTQDFGATLVLVLGTPALIAVAQGIKAWLASRPTATISIKVKDGEAVITGLTSADAAKISVDKIVQALHARK